MLVAAWAATALWPNDRWTAVVYPNRHNLLSHRIVGEFESLELCRAAALDELDDASDSRIGDFECGLNCRPEGGLMVCEETTR